MRTLVRNAGYVPLSVVSFKRAVVLVLAGKAMGLAVTVDYLLSSELALGTPSVILLVRYVRTPRRHSVAVSRRGKGVKGDRTPEEMGWRLRHRPHAPSGPLWALRGSEAVDPRWEEFLQLAA